DECAEGLASARLDRLARLAVERPPRLELLDVLEEDDARPDVACPPCSRPGERADLLALRAVALGSAEVAAVRARPENLDPPSTRHLEWLHLPDARDEMQRLRVVRRVHCERNRVVVERDVRRAPEGLLHAEAGPAPAGKQIDDEAGHSGTSNRD